MTSLGISLTTSLVLMLAAFPLISFGTTDGPPVLMGLGMASLAIGGLIPLVRRYARRKQPPEPPDGAGMSEDVRVS